MLYKQFIIQINKLRVKFIIQIRFNAHSIILHLFIYT